MPSRTRNTLSNYREQGGFLVFRIASSPDFQATVSELKERIPSWARRFDSRNNEWRVKVEYRDIIEELFGPAPRTPASRRASRDEYDRGGQQGQHGQLFWILLSIAIIVTVGALLWSRGPEFVTAIQPEATVAAPLLSATPAPVDAGARVNANANLRQGPGTSFPIQGKAVDGDIITPTGKALGDDGYWWLQLEDGAWIRSDLVVVNNASGLPLDLNQFPTVGAGGGVYAGPPAGSDQPSASPALAQQSVPTLPPPIYGDSRGTVTWIYDGDTASVRIDGVDYKVRYLGIDSPEIDEPGHDEATQVNRDLVMDKVVTLRMDVTNVDRYGRLLRYLYLDDGSFVNEAIVEQGWATATDFPPDTAHINELMEAQERARRQHLGVWGN